ncbi:MAG TPA: M20 family metallo-hydrolase [Thermoplasmataceae archaeon]|nr:M20 family metallo-hydrolase [Thermoplasmataceae archaeon]
MLSQEDISADTEFIIDLAKRIIPVQAISPASGGQGESKRADLICRIIEDLGIRNYQRYDVTDQYGAVRSNIVVREGDKPRTIWIVAHIDTVPVGERSLWKHEPFEATVKGGRIYGRGTSDNGQAVFTSLLLLKRLQRERLRYNLGIAFVADEEVGSRYGIQYLLEKKIFARDDLVLVPDAGTADGRDIEIAEKSILWLKFTTRGKQYHASMPMLAVNANREAMKFMLKLDNGLHEKFNRQNTLFEPPFSTFEPTKHEKNVDNVNTIPGVDVQYLDSRILPDYDLDQVMDYIDSVIREFQRESKATVQYEFFQKEQAPLPTSPDSEIVQKLMEAIRSVRGVEPRTVGIGGGTCAAFFRRKGIDAAVWSTTVPEVAHQADEYVEIDHILNDRTVLEKLIYG